MATVHVFTVGLLAVLVATVFSVKPIPDEANPYGCEYYGASPRNPNPKGEMVLPVKYYPIKKEDEVGRGPDGVLRGPSRTVVPDDWVADAINDFFLKGDLRPWSCYEKGYNPRQYTSAILLKKKKNLQLLDPLPVPNDQWHTNGVKNFKKIAFNEDSWSDDRLQTEAFNRGFNRKSIYGRYYVDERGFPQMPFGPTGIDEGMFEHYGVNHMVDFAIAVYINGKFYVLMIERNDSRKDITKAGSGKYGIPGGKREPSEDPGETAAREVEEETAPKKKHGMLRPFFRAIQQRMYLVMKTFVADPRTSDRRWAETELHVAVDVEGLFYTNVTEHLESDDDESVSGPLWIDEDGYVLGTTERKDIFDGHIPLVKAVHEYLNREYQHVKDNPWYDQDTTSVSKRQTRSNTMPTLGGGSLPAAPPGWSNIGPSNQPDRNYSSTTQSALPTRPTRSSSTRTSSTFNGKISKTTTPPTSRGGNKSIRSKSTRTTRNPGQHDTHET